MVKICHMLKIGNGNNTFVSIIFLCKINCFNMMLLFPCMIIIGVIMGEFLVSKEGIGYLIMYGSQVFNLNLVMTGIFLLLIISAILYYLVILIEKIKFKK